MEFGSLRNIKSSFRQMRLFGIVFLLLCAVVTVWSVWSSYRSAGKQREKIYVLDNGENLVLALSQDLSRNRPAETREHVRRFHGLLFTLSPEKSTIEHNVKHALLLADKNVYHYYLDLAEKGYYNRIIAGNINQVLKVDSAVYDFNAYPHRTITYTTQKIIRQSNVTERSLVTTCRLLNTSWSDGNPNDFTIEGFTIIGNEDSQAIKRQWIMKWKVKSIRKTMWGVYWRPHDKRKQLAARLKRYLDGLPPEARYHTVLGMLAAFMVLALYIFSRAIYSISRDDDSHMKTGHAGRVELSIPTEANNHSTLYLCGTDEE